MEHVNMEQVQAIIVLLKTHAWVPLASLVLGIIIRVLKSDTKLPTIPPRARIWVALGLGGVVAALDAITGGEHWVIAVVTGVGTTAIAVLGHETLINSVRGGKEIPIPGIMIPGAAPSPGKPVTVPPKEGPPPQPTEIPPAVIPPPAKLPEVKDDDPTSPGLGLMLVFAAAAACATATEACSPAANRTAARAALTASEIACIFASDEQDAGKLASICAVARELIPTLRDLIGQREGARRAGVQWPGRDAGVGSIQHDGGT